MFFHWKILADPAAGVPEPEKPVIKYNPPLDLWVKLYLLSYFTIFLAIFFHFEYDRPNLSLGDFYAKIAFFVVTMQCYGAFFDGRKWAPLAESLRCLGVLGYYAVLIWYDMNTGPHRISVMSLHAAAAAFWAGYLAQQWCNSRVSAQEEAPKPTQAFTQSNVISQAVPPPPPYTEKDSCQTNR